MVVLNLSGFGAIASNFGNGDGIDFSVIRPADNIIATFTFKNDNTLTFSQKTIGGEGNKSYIATFSVANWTAGTGECTITIPAATHKLSGNIVDCKAFASISGGYRAGVWASLETYATAAENGDIVLHYPDTSGYAGVAVLTAYEIPS